MNKRTASSRSTFLRPVLWPTGVVGGSGAGLGGCSGGAETTGATGFWGGSVGSIQET
jgi:hypothetical protein